MNIKLSKNNWEQIGLFAGWIKTAQSIEAVVNYKGFYITFHKPAFASKLQNYSNMFYYKVDGKTISGNDSGLKALLQEAKAKIDKAIDSTPSGNKSEILRKITPLDFDHTNPINYAQRKPYTNEEYEKLQTSIGNSAKAEEYGLSIEELEDNAKIRRRKIRVTFNNGDKEDAIVNGTKAEIIRYYLPYGSSGVDQSYDSSVAEKVRRPIKVEFLV